MASYVALLRGINVGGRNMVAMADLRDVASALGLANPRTILQSGNLVIDTNTRTGAQLERLLEQALEQQLGVRADVLVRTAAEWHELVAENPFRAEASRDPAHVLVMCLKEPPPDRAVKALQDAITGPEVVRARGRELYAVYPTGIGRSRLTNTLIEKTLATRGTARNWNTVLKMAALCGDFR